MSLFCWSIVPLCLPPTVALLVAQGNRSAPHLSVVCPACACLLSGVSDCLVMSVRVCAWTFWLVDVGHWCGGAGRMQLVTMTMLQSNPTPRTSKTRRAAMKSWKRSPTR